MIHSVDELMPEDKLKIKSFFESIDQRKYVRDFIRSKFGDKLSYGNKFVDIPKPVILQAPPDGSHAFDIKILSARAFLGFLNPDPQSKLVFDINIAGKRFRTKPTEAEADPLVTDKFSFNTLQPFEALSNNGIGQVCAVLIAGQRSTIYGTGTFEWRTTVCGPCTYAVELFDINGDSCGVLNMRVEVCPYLATQDEVEKAITSGFKKTSHICKLSSRYVPTPYHALRFCSLLCQGSLTYSASAKIVEDKDEENQAKIRRFFSLHSLLSTRSGTKKEISILLCSFLCGFGFEAFVIEPYYVITVQDEKCLLWDHTNGTIKPVEHIPTQTLIGFQKRLEPLVQKPTNDIHDPRYWREIELPKAVIPPPLTKCHQINEEALDQELKRRICLLRGKKATLFDKRLENALMPQLFSLESDKLNKGADVWCSDVKEATIHAMPPHSELRIAHFCINSCEPSAITTTLREKADQLLQATDNDLFALCFHVFPYAEDVVATWVFFAHVVFI